MYKRQAVYTPYNNDFSNIINLSKERIAKNDQFKLIDENAKWINERKDEKQFSLNLEKYQARQKEVEEKAKKFKAISKYKSSLKFSSLPSELARVEKDTLLKSKRDSWHEMLNSDIYIEEGVKILKDLDTKKIHKVSGDKSSLSPKL